MRILFVFLRKEFRQIFRNKTILAILFIIPMMQFLVLPLAVNYEFRNINLVLVDHDHSDVSRQLISRVTGSGYFRLVANAESYNDANTFIENDAADVILEIPPHFERQLVREGSQKVFIAMNAINGTKASLGGNYLSQIISNFNSDIAVQFNPGSAVTNGIGVTQLNWFNPDRDYNLSLIPGLLALLVTIVGGFLSAFNIVKEKEVGTIEQINVTPVSKSTFILAKLIPFWVLANIVFSIGLILAYFVYHIHPQGSLLGLYAFVSVYLLAVLGFGLLISTFCDTQQQAMFMMFFFMMIFLLLGGLFSPLESMPGWVQLITKLNPVSYLIQVIRMILLKGSTLADVIPQLTAIIIMAVVLNTWAILNYRKTS